jgi:hypothetical protein
VIKLKKKHDYLEKNPLEVRDWIKKIDKKAARINSR